MPRIFGCVACFLLLVTTAAFAAEVPALRPPAVPLVTFDPYLSVWSEADRLTDDTTRHWTHAEHALVSLIRIDGKPFRLMGDDPRDVPALPQTGLRVLPTRSIYDFDDGRVHVTLTFMTAALPDDLDVYARPLSYITWQVRSVDGASHAVSMYDSVSSQLAVNSRDQKVTWGRERGGRADGAARRHRGAGGVETARRRHAHRLGLRLPGGARRRGEGGHRRGRGGARPIHQPGNAAGTRRRQACRGRRTRTSRSWRSRSTWGASAPSRCRGTRWSPTTRCTRSTSSAGGCGPTGGGTARRPPTCCRRPRRITPARRAVRGL